MTRTFEGNRVRDIGREHLEAVDENEMELIEAHERFQGQSMEVDAYLEHLERSSEAQPLGDVVSRLSGLVGDLKDQLKELVKVNEALESDLEDARVQVTKGAQEREALLSRLHEAKEETAGMEDLRAEVGQLSRERDTLAEKLRDLGWMLATSEQRVEETGKLLDRFRAERNDACKEAECLNAQFSRAMKVIGELKSSLADSQDLEVQQKKRIEFLKRQLDTAVEQRDAFKSELAKSREALEEVRQSILAASREVR